jgi:hypothetical protein
LSSTNVLNPVVSLALLVESQTAKRLFREFRHIAAEMGETMRRVAGERPPNGENCDTLCGGWPVECRRVGENAAGTGERSAAARISQLRNEIEPQRRQERRAKKQG